MNRWLYRSLPWLVIIGLFALWEAIVHVFAIPSFFLPPPSEVFVSLWTYRVPILENAWVTLYETLGGFTLATVIGMAMGVAIGASQTVHYATYPTLIAFNTMPKSALVPIIVMWFGIGVVPAIITSFLISFFPILVNVATGISTVEPELQDVLRALGARKRVILWKVSIPRSLPYLFASLKVAIAFSFIGAIVSEISAANSGIGHLTSVASSELYVALSFAALLVISAMGVAMYLVMAQVEKRTTGWSVRGLDVVAG
jgi:NitT/TauT family transport system permease protein